jgi:hypothetical protein
MYIIFYLLIKNKTKQQQSSIWPSSNYSSSVSKNAGALRWVIALCNSVLSMHACLGSSLITKKVKSKKDL